MPPSQMKPKSKHSQRKIRNLIINPKYQLKYVFWLSSTGLGLVAINTAIFYKYIRENYMFLVDLSPMTDEAKAQLYQELNEIIFKLGAVSSCFLILIAGLGIFLSHRTAGPMFHFKGVFAKIRAGDRNARIHLRPGDDFQDVANDFNAMMDSIAPPAPKG